MMTELYVKATMFLNGLKEDNRGVTAIEYGLIAVAMAVLLAAVLTGTDGFLSELDSAFDTVTDNISDAAAVSF
ncbi:Flp family type IVb pilin [Vibrio sp. 10N.261.51.F12]|uniref:Flp family type IVb pilin n=1 Tax=Vibrio sp. 10N.261.51.F12 TaxID=3229679 RepID=UPI00354F27F7